MGDMNLKKKIASSTRDAEWDAAAAIVDEALARAIELGYVQKVDGASVSGDPEA
jgi:hypothetical protein